MDTSRGQTAADVVNNYSEEDLVRIIRKWGEEKFAGRIANRIVAARAAKPFTTTGELVEQIRGGCPGRCREVRRTPCQADVPGAADRGQRGTRRAGARGPRSRGRPRRWAAAIVVMSYHSLEDKIVKSVFQAGSKSSAPLGFPVELEEHKAELKTLTKGTEVPTAVEIAENPRAASARLRAVERIRARRAA